MSLMIDLQYTSLDTQRSIIEKCIREGLQSEEDTAILFIDKKILQNRQEHILNCFPKIQQHTAIKTNPLSKVLDQLVQLGSGLEAASYEEVVHGLQHTDRVIFDSPAKTVLEIQKLNQIEPTIIINANSFSELALLKDSKHQIGLRINPLVDVGSPSDLTVSDNRSKFGVPISLEKEIMEAFETYDNITGIHIHIGSQIGDYQAWVQAISTVFHLAEKINAKHSDRVKFIDIGGGLPSDYTHRDTAGMRDIAKQVHRTVPQLFEKYTVYSEFGRFVHANAGWAVTRVEDVLPYTSPKTAVIHIGADMFLRDVYSNNKIHHSIEVFEELEANERESYQIAGPLCFGGDFINRNIDLPKGIQKGNRLIIQDIGANTFSLWSMHCSRSFPKVILHDGEQAEIIKDRVDAMKMIQFWQ